LTGDWFVRLDAWRDFYILVGTVAATLMGLMFVVVSLGQSSLRRTEGAGAIRAFFTPTVAFFATAMLVSVLFQMPHTPETALGIVLECFGFGGIGYMIATGAHRRWRESDLGVDDLLWYVALPVLSYLALAAAGAGMLWGANFGLYCTAATMMALLVAGIRNAWDLVVYIIRHNEP
jgi:hypothetical protein